METDQKATPASEFDVPLIKQKNSQPLTRPILGQVSFTYRFAAH
jgi:hypothetical protein